MTDHLPECRYYPQQSIVGDVGCICDRLRACETRVRRSVGQESCDQHLAAWEVQELRQSCEADGYAAGLAAAHDAVAAHFHAGCDSCDAAFVFGPHALAAIDALTDGGCRTPDDPCADPDACDSLTCARERLHLTLRDEADALAAIDALRQS